VWCGAFQFKLSPHKKLGTTSTNVEILQYLFKVEKPNIAIILINIYTVHNQVTEDGMAWRGMMTP
jgi:hypothetical protein